MLDAKLRLAFELILVLTAHSDPVDALAHIFLNDSVAHASQVAVAPRHRAITIAVTVVTSVGYTRNVAVPVVQEHGLAEALAQRTLIACRTIWRLCEVATRGNIVVAATRCDALWSNVDHCCQSTVAVGVIVLVGT